jgi:hypothetical protein
LRKSSRREEPSLLGDCLPGYRGGRAQSCPSGLFALDARTLWVGCICFFRLGLDKVTNRLYT